MTEQEAAYIAGILDGEGCLSGNVSPAGVPWVYVAVGMMDDTIPIWLHTLLGGGITRNEKGYASWMLQGAACLQLEPVLPYLRLKRESLELILGFVKTIRGPGKRVDDATRMLRFRVVDELRLRTSRSDTYERVVKHE